MTILAPSTRAEVRYSVTDIGNLGQRYADPSALNELGNIVGQSSPPVHQLKPIYWSVTTGMIDFTPSGIPGSYPHGSAVGINDHNQVVGHLFPDRNTAPRAFVWSPTTSFQSLGTLGGNDSWATAINNAGQIAGYSGIPNGLAHAFIFDPANGMRDLATSFLAATTAMRRAGASRGHSRDR